MRCEVHGQRVYLKIDVSAELRNMGDSTQKTLQDCGVNCLTVQYEKDKEQG